MKKIDKQFEAVCAKNDIARVLRDWENASSADKMFFPTRYVLARLKIIEEFTGESNQPSAEDIFNATRSL